MQVLRTPGALDNIYRTLQTLPGVTAAEEFGSRLAVRGGSPDQNLTVMDGVEIHDPYRLFGLTSAFNPETIQRFELATGGFSVEYGDRLSSLLVVENRDGQRDERSGRVSVAQHHRREHRARGRAARRCAVGSWLLTGRRTYYDLIAERFTDQQFPAFGDVQMKERMGAGARAARSLVFGLRSRQAAALEIDEDSVRGRFQDDTENDLAWVRFETSIGARGQLQTVVAYSDTRSTFGVDALFENTSRRSNSPVEDTFGVADVVFERALTVQDLSVRQGLAGPLAITSSRQVRRRTGCPPDCDSRSPGIGTRWPPTDRACRVARGCRTCSAHSAGPRGAVHGCRTRGSSGAGRSRQVSAWTGPASHVRRCCRRGFQRR